VTLALARCCYAWVCQSKPQLVIIVRCLWVNDQSFSSTRSICVVPDGCVDIIWTRDRLCIAGPDTRASLEQFALEQFAPDQISDQTSGLSRSKRYWVG
jgi:hypothetical protein